MTAVHYRGTIMSTTKRLWLGLAALLIASFAVMLWLGTELIQTKPPIPARVVTSSGQVLYTRDDIQKGQQVWQSIGGQQLGSIWGHGALVAPDWSADWLHRETEAMLELQARDATGESYASLDESEKARLQAAVKPLVRTNTFDAAKDEIVVSDMRAQAISMVAAHYESVFSNDPATRDLREAYAMKNDTVPDAGNRRAMTAFFFWTAWAASTERPGTVATYTNNWPPEPLIGNQPTPENILWSLACVVILIAGVGSLIWGWAFLRRHDDTPLVAADKDPLTLAALTPSQRALGK